MSPLEIVQSSRPQEPTASATRSEGAEFPPFALALGVGPALAKESISGIGGGYD